ERAGITIAWPEIAERVSQVYGYVYWIEKGNLVLGIIADNHAVIEPRRIPRAVIDRKDARISPDHTPRVLAERVQVKRKLQVDSPFTAFCCRDSKLRHGHPRKLDRCCQRWNCQCYLDPADSPHRPNPWSTSRSRKPDRQRSACNTQYLKYARNRC